jgi:hypothetical protein
MFQILDSPTLDNLENFQDQIFEIIKDYTNNLLTSNCEGNVQEIAILLNSRIARSKLASLLYQEKFRENHKHLLDSSSFDNLKVLVFSSLLAFQTQNADYEDARLLTKSLFYYYKHETVNNEKINYLLYKDIIKRKGSFQIWLDKDFWLYFIETEIEENSLSIGSIFNNVDAYNFNIISKVANYMIDLKINFDFIKKSIYETFAKSFITKVN